MINNPLFEHHTHAATGMSAIFAKGQKAAGPGKRPPPTAPSTAEKSRAEVTKQQMREAFAAAAAKQLEEEAKKKQAEADAATKAAAAKSEEARAAAAKAETAKRATASSASASAGPSGSGTTDDKDKEAAGSEKAMLKNLDKKFDLLAGKFETFSELFLSITERHSVLEERFTALEEFAKSLLKELEELKQNSNRSGRSSGHQHADTSSSGLIQLDGFQILGASADVLPEQIMEQVQAAVKDCTGTSILAPQAFEKKQQAGEGSRNPKRKVTMRFPPYLRRTIIAAAKLLKQRHGYTVADLLTKEGWEKRNKRWDVFQQLREEGKAPTWRNGADIRYKDSDGTFKFWEFAPAGSGSTQTA